MNWHLSERGWSICQHHCKMCIEVLNDIGDIVVVVVSATSYWCCLTGVCWGGVTLVDVSATCWSWVGEVVNVNSGKWYRLAGDAFVNKRKVSLNQCFSFIMECL